VKQAEIENWDGCMIKLIRKENIKMLEDSSYGESEVKQIRRPEKCQPDYEDMIKRLKEKMARSFAFRDSAFAYFEGRTVKNKMAELIGELVTESNSLQREYDALIEAQENEKGA